MMYDFDAPIDRRGSYTLKWDEELEHYGEHILPFGTASMDFPCAKPILDAIKRVADNGQLGYPKIRDSYYTSIEEWLLRHGNWHICRDWLRQCVSIYPTCYIAIEMFTDPEDCIIIQPPVHSVFSRMIEANGRKVLYNPLVFDGNKYRMDLIGLNKIIAENPNAKMLWLCNPQNPIGKAWDYDELKELGEICVKNGIRILADEVYSGLTYPGKCYTPIASISKEISDVTLTALSASKTYNTTGSKHSFAVISNPEMRNNYDTWMTRMCLGYGKDTIGLAVTEAALRQCEDWREQLMVYISGTAKVIEDFLAQNIPDAKLVKADSTYFAWIDFGFLGFSRQESIDFFRKIAGVIVEPGEDFGPGGDGFIRMNIGCPRAMVIEGLRRIAAAIDLEK